jgi:hypothetical protein
VESEKDGFGYIKAAGSEDQNVAGQAGQTSPKGARGGAGRVMRSAWRKMAESSIVMFGSWSERESGWLSR